MQGRTLRAERRRETSQTPVHEREGRERILEAAVRSFAELGYAGTTTAGVARGAGVTQPLVHHHFGSKEGLWRAAMDHLFAELPAMVVAAQRPTDPQDELARMVTLFVRLSAARPDLARILSREGAVPSPRLTYLVKRHVRPALVFAVSSLKSAQQAGLVARNLRPELLLFFALGAGSHIFDVGALAKQALGVDVASEETREAFAALFHRVFDRGVRPTR